MTAAEYNSPLCIARSLAACRRNANRRAAGVSILSAVRLSGPRALILSAARQPLASTGFRGVARLAFRWPVCTLSWWRSQAGQQQLPTACSALIWAGDTSPQDRPSALLTYYHPGHDSLADPDMAMDRGDGTSLASGRRASSKRQPLTGVALDRTRLAAPADHATRTLQRALSAIMGAAMAAALRTIERAAFHSKGFHPASDEMPASAARRKGVPHVDRFSAAFRNAARHHRPGLRTLQRAKNHVFSLSIFRPINFFNRVFAP